MDVPHKEAFMRFVCDVRTNFFVDVDVARHSFPSNDWHNDRKMPLGNIKWIDCSQLPPLF